MDDFGTSGKGGRTYGPRTAWFCSNCGSNLMSPSSRCNCGGGARPEGMIEETPSQGLIARLANRVSGLFGRRPG